MSNIVKDLDVTIEELIAIRDNRCETLSEKDTVAYACNVLENLIDLIKKIGRV